MAETKTDKPDTEKADKAPAEQPKPTSKPTGEPKCGYWWGTGRRKTSVARVRIRPGDGKLVVNRREINDYFKREQDKITVLAPLKAVNGEKSFDVFINVRGGGSTGQSGAARLGIARALKGYDENYMQQLRDGGYLTRDSRMVERKKYGQSGARKRYQFSKR